MKDRKALGVLYLNESKNGKIYLSGHIDGKKVVGFRAVMTKDTAKLKKGDEFFNIYESEDKPVVENKTAVIDDKAIFE